MNKIFSKRDKVVIVLFIVLFVVLFVVVIIYLGYTGFFKIDETKSFCIKQCKGADKLISYSNNLTYNFIECKCAENVKQKEVYRNLPKISFDEVTYYFNSNTFDELNKNEILESDED